METDIFNANEALSRIDNDMTLLKEIAGLFLQNYPAQLDKIRSAIAQSNSKGLEYAAHDVKGSVGHFCAKYAFEAALRLEIMGRENSWTDVKEAYATLEKEIERLRSKLEAVITENPSGIA